MYREICCGLVNVCVQKSQNEAKLSFEVGQSKVEQ